MKTLKYLFLVIMALVSNIGQCTKPILQKEMKLCLTIQFYAIIALLIIGFNGTINAQNIATISKVDQQVIKGWGCCPLWIGNNDVSVQPLTQQATYHMGATIIRMSQLPETGDGDGNIVAAEADKLCRAIKVTTDNGYPYILSSWSPPTGMKTIQVSGSVSNNTPVSLLPAKEQTLCDFDVKLLNYIHVTKGLPLPINYSLQNEPTCSTPWAGCIYDAVQYKRVVKLLRATLDAAGYSNLMLLGSEDGGYNNGQGWNWSVGLLGGTSFPSLIDADFNKAISAFASHSYDWTPNTTSTNYNAWINGCDKWGKDRWMTEYCYIEDTKSPHAVGTVRRFISDLAYIKNNYWFTWTVNDGYGNDSGDNLCFGNGVSSLTKKPTYYVLKKLFTSIPVNSKVRRMTITDQDLITANAGKMDMVAFVSDTNMVAVMVNPTSAIKTTAVNGLAGTLARIYQIASIKNNTDMSLISTQTITDGTISTINLPVNSVTIIVTTGLATKTSELKGNQELFKVFPTVCNDHVTIQSMDVNTNEYDLLLADVKGQKIISRNIHTSNSYELDISGVENGAYFLSLKKNNKEQVVQKIVVKR